MSDEQGSWHIEVATQPRYISNRLILVQRKLEIPQPLSNPAQIEAAVRPEPSAAPAATTGIGPDFLTSVETVTNGPAGLFSPLS